MFNRPAFHMLTSGLLLAAAVGHAAAPALAQEAPLLVQRIQVQGNRRTQDSVILRELLFGRGDTLVPGLVAESERNLRRLLFLGQVEVGITARGDSADVVVRVNDLYSRATSPVLYGGPGELSYGLVAMDYNLMGRGHTMRLSGTRDAVTGYWGDARYVWPRPGGTAAQAETVLGAGTEGRQSQLGVSVPFRALTDRQAWGLKLYSQEDTERLYLGQELVSRYGDHLDGCSFWYTRSEGHAVKIRPSISLQLSRRRFSPKQGFVSVPSDRTRVLPGAALVIWHPRYVRARFVHALGSQEDLQTGSWLAVSVSRSSRALGSDRNFTAFSVQLMPRALLPGPTYAFAELSSSWRSADGLVYQRRLHGQLISYTRVGQSGSVALRLAGDSIDRPEDPSQFLLGLYTGLRGYAPRRYDGTRRLLGSLEYRPTLRVRRSYAAALALFAETGSAWTPGSTRAAWHRSMGAGMRLGLPHVYNTPVLRADIAWGWSDRAAQLSVGVGQYF
jgi:hypothetical protein